MDAEEGGLCSVEDWRTAQTEEVRATMFPRHEPDFSLCDKEAYEQRSNFILRSGKGEEFRISLLS